MTLAVRLPLPDAAPQPPGLREAMRHLVGGVSIVTAGIGEDRSGLTVTTAHSLSVEPPTMIVCVNREASSWPIILRHRHFAVSLLAETHRAVADRFAGRGGVKGAARYAEADWVAGPTGALMLADAIAAVDCELEEAVERHSHAILIGAVRAVRVGTGAPLVYGHGRYAAIAPL